MRAPRRRRPLVRQLGSWRTNAEELRALEGKVHYVGSPEHKDIPSFAGQPRPRADASICPRELTRDRDKVQAWLEEGIRRGAVSELREGKHGFPRYVWFRDRELAYEGRLVNSGNGEYKGYPLEADETPAGLEELYE